MKIPVMALNKIAAVNKNNTKENTDNSAATSSTQINKIDQQNLVKASDNYDSSDNSFSRNNAKRAEKMKQRRVARDNSQNKIIGQSENLESLIKKVMWKKFKLVN